MTFQLAPASAFKRTGASWTGVRSTSLKLCNRMSAVGIRRASFQTMLTVPAGSLTAIRGKSLGGALPAWLGTRLNPGMNATSTETLISDTCAGWVAQGVGVRQEAGT